jgi:NAD(P)-dependent dehydrogenase (short-subunit alcohol dehydrogenase family)
MDNAKRVAVVTGGNRGIGFEVCRQLARTGLHVVLTGRDLAKAEQASRVLQGEGLDVVTQGLDVTDAASVAGLEQFIRDHHGRIDVLVNNAGISVDQARGIRSILDGPVIDALRETRETNLVGPMRLCQALVPVMKQAGYGRVVNVSSQLGSLSSMGTGYETYRITKTALNAATRILAAELRGTGILVNAACPGWVRTDMGGPNAPRTPEQGADTIVWLATLPDDGPSGGYFQDRKSLPW